MTYLLLKQTQQQCGRFRNLTAMQKFSVQKQAKNKAVAVKH